MRILVRQIERMVEANGRERAFLRAFISTIAKHDSKIYPQALVVVDQLTPARARLAATYQQGHRLFEHSGFVSIEADLNVALN